MQLDGGTVEIGAPPGSPDPNTVHVRAGGILGGAGLILGPKLVGKVRVIVHKGGVFLLLVGNSVLFDLTIEGSLRGSKRARGAGSGEPLATPEPPTATFKVDGDVVMEPGSTLNIEVAGTSPLTGYSVLEATGDVTLGGKLGLSFVDGFAPKKGQTFEFLRFNAKVAGQFEGVEFTGLAPGFQAEVTQTAAGTLSLRALNDGVPTSLPSLSIQSAGDQLTIHWPITVLGYALEGATNFTAPAWQTIPATSNRVTFIPDVPMKFFRLRK